MKSAKKIVLMAPNLTWVVSSKIGMPHHQVYSVYEGESKTPAPLPRAECWSADVGTLQQWIAEQPATIEAERPDLDASRLSRRDSGLYVYADAAGVQRVYVPLGRRTALFEATHEAIEHLGADKTYRRLAQDYFWPTCRRDVRERYAACTFCETAKAKRNLATGRRRAVQGSPPRSRYGMDFYGVGDGYVLGLIDLDSLWVELKYCEHRSADEVRDAVQMMILKRHG